MRVLVTFAVDAEFAPWRRRHDFQNATTSSDEKVYRAAIDSAEIVVGLTGIGPTAAASRICGFSWCENIDICISSGFAGGLRAGHVVGDILAATEILPDEPRAKKLGRRLISTKRLLLAAKECGAKVVDRFYSSPTTIQTAEEKAAFRDIADAVEMESFEVLSEALAWAPEAIAIRAISDSADEDLPLDFDAVVTGQGRISAVRLAAEIVRKPRAIPGLVRLGRNSGEAANRLADFLDSYIHALVLKSQTMIAGANPST